MMRGSLRELRGRRWLVEAAAARVAVVVAGLVQIGLDNRRVSEPGIGTERDLITG